MDTLNIWEWDTKSQQQNSRLSGPLCGPQKYLLISRFDNGNPGLHFYLQYPFSV